MLGMAHEIIVATIYDNGEKSMESQINEWLRKHPNVEVLQIHFTTVSTTVNEHGVQGVRSQALIVYRKT